MINEYNYLNKCNCCGGNNIKSARIDALSVDGKNIKNVINVTNNRAQYFADLAKQYKNEAKELRDSAKYYAEQNSDVTKSYVDNGDIVLQLAIDSKQDTLVSGSNVKTINSFSLLGEGNIDVATTLQGSKADTALQPNDNITLLTNNAGYITSSAITDKANYNLSNLTDTGKIAASGYAMPSGTSQSFTVGAGGTQYTAPANGWMEFSTTFSAASGYMFINNVTGGVISLSQHAGNNHVYVPVYKGDIVEIGYGTSGSTQMTASSLHFVYAKGSESEAG